MNSSTSMLAKDLQELSKYYKVEEIKAVDSHMYQSYVTSIAKLTRKQEEGIKMEYDYTPRGVCSRNIHVEVEDGIVKNVIFTGGCSGNTQGVAALAKGMKVDEVIERLKDIKCGAKPTSCPAQLAKSLQEHAK